MDSTHLTAEAVSSKILDLAAEFCERGQTISPGSILRDIGFDELDAVELVMAVEDEFEVDLDPQLCGKDVFVVQGWTVQALVDVTVKALGDKRLDSRVRAGLPVEGAKPEAGQVWRSRSGDLVTIRRVNSFGAFPVISTDGNAYRRDGVSCMSVGFANGGDLIDRVDVQGPKDGNKAADGGPVGEHAPKPECIVEAAEAQGWAGAPEAVEARAKIAPKLTPANIEAVIVAEQYFTAEHGINGALVRGELYGGVKSTEWMGSLAHVTFCVLLLRNGTKVTGVNHGPVSAANFDAAKGREYARANAIEKVWELEDYLLRERLANPLTVLEVAADPEADKAAQVLEIVRDFVQTYEIACPEVIHQTDRVITNAYRFIERVAEVVGYYRDPDDEEEARP